MTILQTLTTFIFYRRYRWTAANFTTLQTNILGYSKALAAALSNDSGVVYYGLNYVSDNLLEVTMGPGVAFGQDGQLLALNANTSVALTASKKHLIVLRPATANANNITRPTNPFETVPLNSVQSTTLVAIAGPDANTYPSKAAGDVVLMGLTTDGTEVTALDHTQCELLGKSDEISKNNRFNLVVGNARHCTHLTLEDALAVAANGDRIRVTEDQTVETMLTVADNVEIHFDPGVEITRGAALIGLDLTADQVKIFGGRFAGFTGGTHYPIRISSDFCLVMGSVIESGTNGINDVNGTSNTAGVIYEN